MIYFDNAATSKFKPNCVLDATVNVLKNSANSGRASHNDALSCAQLIHDTRTNIKEILNANDEYQVIFTKNTSEALNIAILGYINRLYGKVHVITSMMEHNSVLRPLKYLADRNKIDVTIMPLKDGNISVADIELHIRNNTRLICLNMTSNVTGACIDIDYLSSLSTAYNIPVLLDCAQSMGHYKFNLNITPVAMLAAPGHKGLHAPQGSGFLLVNTKKIQLNPMMYGGTGTLSNELAPQIEYPDSFEIGTLNTPSICGLNAGITWTYSHFDEINNHITNISSQIYDYLASRNDITLYSDKNSTVIAFNVSDYTSNEIADALNESNIAVRSGLHCAPLIHSYYGTLRRGMVRISPGMNNTPDDVEKFIEVMEYIR